MEILPIGPVLFIDTAAGAIYLRKAK